MPAISASKATFVADLQAAFNQLIGAKLALADLVNFYFKNGFNSGGSNPIADGDVSGNGLTAAKVAGAITLAQQLANFFGNSAVTTGDYEATAQAIRTS
jgi:hypothetical protein